MPMLEGPKKMESQESGIYGESMDIDRGSPHENGHYFGMPSQQSVYDPAEELFRIFDHLTMQEQMESVKGLISRMTFHQHEHIFSFLMPMLQRDFISTLTGQGLPNLAGYILSFLDAKSLSQAELVCKKWYAAISDGQLWKKLIQRQVRVDPLWRGLSERRGWGKHLFSPLKPEEGITAEAFRLLYPQVISDIKGMEQNWKHGHHTLKRIQCNSENSKGVYCLQYDDHKIVSGLRDNTIKVWDRESLECTKVLKGHTGSVLCLQYDEQVIVTGSSDATIRVWDVHTGEMLNTLLHHCEAVLHLRFNSHTMVTCSKDRTIAVWDIKSPKDIVLRRVLVGHRAAVNVVDFDDKYIVSASGDRTIKVWKTSTSEFVRTLHGHRRGIACLQYKGQYVVSGSSDNTIRIWDIECGASLRLLEGHDELVRCIRFDDRKIVSGAYDGTIKVWDLKAALDPRTPVQNLCLRTLVVSVRVKNGFGGFVDKMTLDHFQDFWCMGQEHTGRVFRLQFDDFQIISSSHDDSILIWDFLDPKPGLDVFSEHKMEVEKQISADCGTPRESVSDHVTSI